MEKDIAKCKALVHKIKSPLTAVLGYADLISLNVSNNNFEKTKSLSDKLKESTLKVTELVEMLEQELNR